MTSVSPPPPEAPAAAPAAPDTQPLSLDPLHFPFRALAGFSARAPLGGSREAGIACFVAARLASELLASDPLPPAIRATRAASARAWMAAMALPAVLRVPLARLVDASGAILPAGADGDEVTRSRASAAATALSAACKGHLDGPSRGELEQLARALGRPALAAR